MLSGPTKDVKFLTVQEDFYGFFLTFDIHVLLILIAKKLTTTNTVRISTLCKGRTVRIITLYKSKYASKYISPTFQKSEQFCRLYLFWKFWFVKFGRYKKKKLAVPNENFLSSFWWQKLKTSAVPDHKHSWQLGVRLSDSHFSIVNKVTHLGLDSCVTCLIVT